MTTQPLTLMEVSLTLEENLRIALEKRRSVLMGPMPDASVAKARISRRWLLGEHSSEHQRRLSAKRRSAPGLARGVKGKQGKAVGGRHP